MMAVKVDGSIYAPAQMAFEYVRDHEADHDARTTFVTESVKDNFKVLSSYTKLPLPLTNRRSHYGVWKYEKVNGNFWAIIAESIPSRRVKGYVTSIILSMHGGDGSVTDCIVCSVRVAL
jgi:hypothetical protein